ncbi:MAG: 4-hydroxythreonine-4-phosphate dehydrogenase PdxA [Bacteroidetes bacterium]|nr:MAG: 4-hydroxythreonine-4-phosphate dehydrogenase PdxA [Bacteroidota bacterium]
MLNIKPKIGITIGDLNGIGAEVIMKALSDSRILRLCTPIIYGSSKVLSKYKKLLNNETFNYQLWIKDQPLAERKINVVNCWEDNFEVELGKVSPEAGKAAFLAINKSSEDLKAGLIDAVVTAPINKHNIQNPNFQFPGHTEYYAANFGTGESLMLLIAEELRVGTVTGHIPVSKISESISKEKIIAKTNVLLQSLKYDFGIKKPRVAILGLNPHAGEDGLLGMEEKEVIEPAIQVLKRKGHLVFGAFPADGFFATKSYTKYDAVLAMYHDQGLIPFKMLGFENGVNFTAGLSTIRTSPDHGTAYDIAGKGIASEESLRSAIFLAIDVFKSRILNPKPAKKEEFRKDKNQQKNEILNEKALFEQEKLEQDELKKLSEALAKEEVLPISLKG